MKTISLITKTKITSELISKELISNFPYKKEITQNDEKELFIGKYPKEFYIIFSDTYKVNDKDSMFETEEKAIIPFDDAFAVEMYYRSDEVAKYVLETINKFYPELFIFCDCPEYVGPAKNFINGDIDKANLSKRLDNIENLKELIGTKVTVYVDRQLGSTHPKYKDMIYPINYGYIKEIKALDNEYQDAYILGVKEPLTSYEGVVIGIVNRIDDVEDKLIVSNIDMSIKEIEKEVEFQEKYFKHIIIK